MDRIILIDLLDWRDSTIRKPLILRGARQVGKTHVVRQFGRYFDNYVEINFEQLTELQEIFSGDLDPQRLLRDLSLLSGNEIIPGKTLLFLDEIQQVPRAITALRYFYEEMPELHVIAAGSLLEFAIQQVGVPVGRVSFLYLHQLSFIEYLKALGYKQIIKEILNHAIDEPLVEPVHKKYLALVGEFIAIGGMPEAIHAWINQQNIKQCQHIHHDIINTYREDFHKYAKKTQYKYLNLIFDETPKLQGRPLVYSSFSGDYRKRELEPCLTLLCDARIVRKIYSASGQGLPLAAEASYEKFKLSFIDTALSQAILGLQLEDWFLKLESALSNKGAIAEAFVGQEILAYSDTHTDARLYYWQREARGSLAGVDYLIQRNREVIPLEVKSGKGSSLRSLRRFLELHEKSDYGIRISQHNYSVFDHIHSIPLYAVASLSTQKDKLMKFVEGV